MKRERGTSTVVGLIVALAIFSASFAVLATSMNQPLRATPTAAQADLKNQAANALGILLTTSGAPQDWATSSNGVDHVAALGLVSSSGSSFVDPMKFDAMRRGRLASSASDGAIDYPEALAALGLRDYQLHVRAYPIFDQAPNLSGLHVAYIGHYLGAAEQTESIQESATLASLPVHPPRFVNVLHDLSPAGSIGDKYADDSQTLRETLVPLLGGWLSTVHANGTPPASTWHRVGSGDLAANDSLRPFEGQYALALGNGSRLSYTKGTDERAVLARLDLSHVSSPHVLFAESVNGGGNESNFSNATAYGLVEASGDGGKTWCTLTPRSVDASSAEHASVLSARDAWRERDLDFSHCSELEHGNDVELAFRWHAEDDGLEACDAREFENEHPEENDRSHREAHAHDDCGESEEGCSREAEAEYEREIKNGSLDGHAHTHAHVYDDAHACRARGWEIDDVSVRDGATNATVIRDGFEGSQYDALVVGSDVVQDALASEPVKSAIRDFVFTGGKLYVLGGEPNVKWLEPLLHAGIQGSSGGVFANDPTDPFLTVPNVLAYGSYPTHGKAWTFSGSADESLFKGIVQSGPHAYVLAESKPGAFGAGLVVLTSYRPFTLAQGDSKSFFVNSFTVGRYLGLFLDFGPSVPPGTAVASADRMTLIDRTWSKSGELLEMRFIAYVWR